MILVTGASGFVGSALVARLHGDGASVRAALRCADLSLPSGVQVAHVADLDAHTDWQAALTDAQVVVHAAARVHVMAESAADPMAEFRRVNVAGTLNLARQAAAAGVGRFVFISSVKVNGEETPPNRPFTVDDAPAPLDPYGISKMEAERGLAEVAAQTGMAVVSIRPPLVYGPGVRANFRALMNAVARGIPLPLGAIHNKRSLVALDNLVDLIVTCTTHTAAANQTFLVSDDEDVSTSELIRRMAKALNRSPRLLPVPVTVLSAGARLLGKGQVAQRLCGNLQVDVSAARDLLGWRPPIDVDEGMRRVAAGRAA